MTHTTLPPTLLIIIGITGDLANRKLLPALSEIISTNHQPEQFKIIGVSRNNITKSDILDRINDASKRDAIESYLEVYQLDLDDEADYRKFDTYLRTFDARFGADTQRLFYLSVPPNVAKSITQMLGSSGLAAIPNTKLLLEKPFGTDVASAQELINTTNKIFSEEQIYRIDHYLAKEMAQNILVFRSSNSLFKRTWNKDFIEKIEIIASETIGVEGRAVFYEQTGALRDIVQSHLLQLAALVLMDLPSDEQWGEVSSQRLNALKNISVPTDLNIAKHVTRGQYAGYKDEVKNPSSKVETYVALTLFSNDPKWDGVPIQLITGKSLDRKVTEICIHYRQEDANESNRLVLRIQPHEGIEVYLWSKQPGYERKLDKVTMDFTYKEHFSELPEAYEQVLLDAIKSDHNLFTSSEEVMASWQILAPIQAAWDNGSDDLIIYEPGSNPEQITRN